MKHFSLCMFFLFVSAFSFAGEIEDIRAQSGRMFNGGKNPHPAIFSTTLYSYEPKPVVRIQYSKPEGLIYVDAPATLRMSEVNKISPEQNTLNNIPNVPPAANSMRRTLFIILIILVLCFVLGMLATVSKEQKKSKIINA